MSASGVSAGLGALDLIVIGAGIVGTAVARECARAGLRVAVVEQGATGGATTAAGMGHIVVMDDSPAQLALSACSRRLWLEEKPLLPGAVEYESTGTLWIAADDEEMREVRAKLDAYAQAGVNALALDAQSLAEAEPNLRPGLAGGLLVPDDGVVYPPAAAEAFLREAVELGTQVSAGRAMETAAGRVTLEDGRTLHAPVIVLATGSDPRLLPAMPVRRRKGHLVITDRYPGFARHQLVELGYLKSAHSVEDDSVAFNLQPRRTGQMLIGSSRQYSSPHGVLESRVEAHMVRAMLQRAGEYMPGIGQLSAVRAWTGFRAATEDKLPLIGPAAGVSDDPTLWLAAGFEGLGITNSLGAARLLVDGLLGRPPLIDPAPYLPARLQARTGAAAHA